MTRDEAGMTIVELLVALTILSIISFALTESVVQALRTADVTAKRYGESIDAQLLAASFGPDVQSSDEVDTSSAGGDACAPQPPILLLRWTDGSISKQASYILEAGSGPERHLVRRYCEGGRVVRQHAVASFVAPDRSDPVTVSCPPDPSCTSAPRAVSMAITDASGYTFTATGSRRAS